MLANPTSPGFICPLLYRAGCPAKNKSLAMPVSQLQKVTDRRSGKILVLLALMLTLLMGMAGLVIDSGLLFASHRNVQNVADSAALAAAMELFRGGTPVQAKDAAKTFVTTYNGLTKATVTVNIPPA